MKNRENNTVLLIITLGLLSAFGPFVTDMYLPGLPIMQKYFATSTSLVQLGLTTSMLGLAVGQLIIGPLSDKYGRRRPLLISLWLFILSTVIILFSPDIYTFNTIRFIQGASAAGGIVLSRSISADLFQGPNLARYLAIIAAVNGITPVCAPIIGASVLSFYNWQAIFVILLLIGILILMLSYLFKESLVLEKRKTESLIKTYKNFAVVIRNKTCMVYILQQGFAMGVFFAYISASPFILQSIYGLTSFQYSLCFGLNAFGIGIGSALSMRFRSQENAVRFSSIGVLIVTVITSFLLIANSSIILIECAFFILLLLIGLTLPASAALALNAELRNSGTASALLGAGTFVMGGIASPLVGIGNILIATGITFVVFASLSLLMLFLPKKNLGRTNKASLK